MNYKRSIFFIALLLGSLAVQAAPTYVTIEMKDGNNIDFLLSENPVFTFSKGDLFVNGDAKTSYAVSGVKNYHFTSTVTDLGKVAANSLRVVYIDNSTIRRSFYYHYLVLHVDVGCKFLVLMCES